METTTKEDKLIFFGITFATIAALTYIINYLNPIAKFGFEHIFAIAALLAGVITMFKFGFSEKFRNANAYQISGIIWTALALMKWVKYFKKDNFDWIIASLFTAVAIINWVGFFRKSDK